MKKIFLMTSFIFLIINSAAQKRIAAPKPLAKIQPKVAGDDGTEYSYTFWYNEKNFAPDYYAIESSKKISTVKKQYSIRQGVLYYKNKKVDNLRILYQKDENTDILAEIIHGIPKKYSILANHNPLPSGYTVSYVDGGSNYSFILSKDIFLREGSGYLKQYYYSKFIPQTQKYSEEIIKEEGSVKNNFKVGE